MYSAKIFGSIQSISSLVVSIKPIISNVERVQKFMKWDDNLTLSNSKEGNNINTINTIENIEVNNITFGYSSILYEGMSFKLNKGEIFFNGIPMGELSIFNILKKIGYVSKDLILIKGTVLDNIYYSNEHLNIKDIEKRIKELHLYKLIECFEYGLETKINNDRSGLSAGQIQIISLLRAIIGNVDLLILDEAFTNLDQNIKMEISKLLKSKKIANMIIVISHNEKDLEFASNKYSTVSIRRKYV